MTSGCISGVVAAARDAGRFGRAGDFVAETLFATDRFADLGFGTGFDFTTGFCFNARFDFSDAFADLAVPDVFARFADGAGRDVVLDFVVRRTVWCLAMVNLVHHVVSLAAPSQFNRAQPQFRYCALNS